MIARLSRAVAAVRCWQQSALADMQRLDAAIAANLTHGAMAGNDPLTDSIFDQADAAAACAQEGAVPPVSTGAGLTLQQIDAIADSESCWLDMLPPIVTTVVVCIVLAIARGWL